jgi:hypothetical protein
VLSRVPGDVDVFVTRRVWGRLLERPGWEVLTPKAGDPPILSFADYTINPDFLVGESSIPLSLFYDWSDRFVEMDAQDLIRKASSVKWEVFDFRCIPVEDALAHKQFALQYSSQYVQKHIPDIAIIEEYLDRGESLRQASRP